MVCQSVIVNMYQSLDKKLVKKLDEKRRLMIENELSHLIAEKVKVNIWQFYNSSLKIW